MGTGCSGVGLATEGAGVKEMTAGSIAAEDVKIITDHPTAWVFLFFPCLLGIGPRAAGRILTNTGLGEVEGGEAEGKLKTAGFGFCTIGGRGKGAAGVHAVAGWDGAHIAIEEGAGSEDPAVQFMVPNMSPG